MSVEIFFTNLDQETKQKVLNENNVEYLMESEFDMDKLRHKFYFYEHYLDEIADNELNTEYAPICIYKIEPHLGVRRTEM